MRIRLSALTGSLLAAVVVVGAALASAGIDPSAAFDTFERRSWASHPGVYREADYRASALGRSGSEDEVEFSVVQESSDTAAFPGCEGYGCDALGPYRDSTLAVHKITNLSSDSTVDGSLPAIIADSVSDNTYDIIVPDTSGTIIVDGGWPILVSSGVYMALHAGPGGGIALHVTDANSQRSIGVGDNNSNDPANHVVIRGLMLFAQTCEGVPSCTQGGGFRITNGHDIVIDHSSFYGGEDQTFSINSGRGGSLARVTVSNSVFSATWAATTNSLLGLGIGTTDGSVADVDYLRNLYVGRHRAPVRLLMTGTEYDNGDFMDGIGMVNNVLFAHQSRAFTINADARFDYIRNFVRPHAGNSNEDDILRIQGDPLSTDPDSVPWTGFLLANQNTSTTAGCDSTSTSDWWTNCFTNQGTPIGADSAGHVASSRLTAPTHGYSEVSAAQARDRLITTHRVGHDSAISADGTWRLVQNRWDSLNIDAMADSSLTAIFDAGSSPDSLEAHPEGSFPTITAASGFADTDGDGMPDAFEEKFFGGAEAGDPAADDDGDGYLNIEEYVNGTDPVQAVATFNTSPPRYVARVPGEYVPTGGFDSAGNPIPGSDSTRRPNPDSMAALDVRGCALVGLGGSGAGAGDSVYYCVTSADTPATALDSADVDAKCSATGQCSISTLRTAPLPTAMLWPLETPLRERYQPTRFARWAGLGVT